MRSVLCGAVALLLGSGCAVSDMYRVNLRLKEENTRLLGENRDLHARAQIAMQESRVHLEELERVRQDLARARLRERAPGAAPAPAVFDSGKEFEGIPDIDVAQDARGTRVILSDRVFFQSGKSEITSAGTRILDKVAAVLRDRYGGAQIVIEGHTDNVPIKVSRYPSNWELSAERACAMLRYLAGRGVPEARMRAAAYAFHQPAATNATPEGRAKNRRVEILIPNE